MVRTLVFLFLLAGRAWADDYQELRADDGRCLDATSAGIALKSCKGIPSQHWRSSPGPSGFVKLSTEGGDGMCLDILNDGESNDQLRMAKCANATGQNWKLKGDHGAYRLTTQWRGDGLCLTMRPVHLADCSEGSNWWKPNAVETDGSGNLADAAFDGELPSSHDNKYEFVLLFDDKCTIDLPGEPRDGIPIFKCKRNEQDMHCMVIAAKSLEDMYGIRPSIKRMRALITKDGRAIAFATPKGAFKFTVDTGMRKSTLALASGKKCKGEYVDHEMFVKKKAEYLAEKQASEPAEETSSSSTSSSSVSHGSSAPAKPKGLEHGRMCSRDKECQSGSCKMENKTRGRCQ